VVRVTRTLTQTSDTAGRRIAEQFLAARSDPSDPRVAAAYSALAEQTDHILMVLSTLPPSEAMSVVFTKCATPYASDDEMIAAARTTRTLEVSSAAAESERRHPLLGSELGGSFDRFRAVHDLLGHVLPGYGFDRTGERRAWLAQEHSYDGLARLALAGELQGEFNVLLATGDFADHKAVLLHPGLFERLRQTVPSDDGSPGGSMYLGRSRALCLSGRRHPNPRTSLP
jgi:hypothetical protein